MGSSVIDDPAVRNMNPDRLKQLLEFAGKTVMDAADMINSKMDIGRRTVADLDHDVKIAADQILEDFIVEKLSYDSEYPILSEESGQTGDLPSQSSIRWIVDPLDGSFNFLRAIPLYCISIALWEDQKPLGGVVYDIVNDELFSGSPGLGSYLNGRKISVGTNKKKSQAVLCTGFPAKTDFTDDALVPYVRMIQSFKKIRLIGSAALSLAFLAAGRVDAYYEEDIAIWDVAAGIAIVQGAGGGVIFFPSGPPNRLTVCSASDMHLISNLCS